MKGILYFLEVKDIMIDIMIKVMSNIKAVRIHA